MVTKDRKQRSYQVRLEAAELAQSRPAPNHRANGDEQRFASAHYAMSFTKGLAHEKDTGLVADPGHFEAFRKAIDDGMIDAFTFNVPVSSQCKKRRQWEAPTAGIVYDLEGPDAQAVTMPPAPRLGSAELAYEMAEVYELALLRDQRLTDFRNGKSNPDLANTTVRLNALPYRPASSEGRPRKTDGAGDIDEQTAFRGSSPQVEIGPYLSQFLLIGNVDQPGQSKVKDGLITYGALQIDQRVPVAKKIDYMTNFANWLEVQNGCDVQDDQALFNKNKDRRFISTPRDLATYVHYDALYEAYLNACLILLGMKTPFDPAFEKLSGQGLAYVNDPAGKVASYKRQAGGFALYGPPHILTLVTEVATRALKAVRFQKFNNHLRLRPEALAARIEKAAEIEAKYPSAGNHFSTLATDIAGTVAAVQTANGGSALLPMAFQEGSPMHPSYGAGHAAVAGACVTVLKAYFDTGTVFVRRSVKKGPPTEAFLRYEKGDKALAYVPNAAGSALVAELDGDFLSLEGELNKLAANISLGRNMAGVHYFSDYYDSLRMGEQVAIELLEEQALCYPTDQFVLTLPTFDGEELRIGRR